MEPLEPTPEAETVAPAAVEAAVSVARRIEDNVRRAVKVRDEVMEHVIVSLLAEGHILVEDYPGVGKTALARSIARSIDCAFARVQCTADLLPADIVGTNVFNQREQRFEFRPGPIFANVVIVDEINRASPKTQSGLLECMQERQVTVDAVSHELARPFVVFATQNPVEYEGTYPLPEAQVDRFMVRVSLGYPNAEEEAGMLAGHERAALIAAAETELDGLREHRPGSPASRIHWPAVARGHGMMERKLISEADSRPLVVLDPRAPASEDALDSAVRAAASLCVHFARRTGWAVRPAGACWWSRARPRTGARCSRWPAARASSPPARAPARRWRPWR